MFMLYASEQEIYVQAHSNLLKCATTGYQMGKWQVQTSFSRRHPAAYIRLFEIEKVHNVLMQRGDRGGWEFREDFGNFLHWYGRTKSDHCPEFESYFES